MFLLLLPGGAHVATFTISPLVLGGYRLFKLEKICGRLEEGMALQWLAGHQGKPMGNVFMSIHTILFHALHIVH